MCLLAAHLLQCRSSLCLHPGSELLLSCFYIASLWLRQLLWALCRRKVFAPSSLYVRSQMTWRSVALRFFARSTSRIRRIVKICDVMDRFLRNTKYFLYFRFYVDTSQCIVDLGRYGWKGYTAVVLCYSEVTLLREREDVALCPSVYCVLVIYGITVSEQ